MISALLTATEVTGGSSDPNGQWVHLLPKGEFRGKDGRGPWRADDLTAIIASSQKAANSRSIPIDYDHQIDRAAPIGGSAPAAGWISRMEARPDGIWGLVEWTPSGKAALDAREYRFLSPVITYTPNGRVSAILRAALTNNPNLPQLTALNAAETSMIDNETKQSLCELLSLPAGGDVAAILQAVRILVTSQNTIDPAKYVPIELFQQAVTAANQANAGITRQSAEIVVNQAILDHKMLPFMHEWAVNLCTVNKPAFDAFMENTGPALFSFIDPLTKPTDFSQARQIVGGNSGRVEADDGLGRITAKLGLSPEDVEKYGKRSK